MYDVVALGEILIDFTPYGKSENGNILFERNPGGAPANVLVMLSKLGLKTSFISKVGADEFGKFLKETLDSYKVDTTGLAITDEVNTTLAFVHLQPNGDRSFSFYRKPGADITLEEKEVNYKLIDRAKLFHFGSVSMTNEPARQATLSAIQYAKDKGLLISYDPNLRENLWEDLKEAKKIISDSLYFADILKVSEEELLFLTDSSDYKEGTETLYRNYGISLIFVTLGENGCFFRYKDKTEIIPPYVVRAIDTTGSGDAFFGALLYKILEKSPIEEMNIEGLKSSVLFANAAGALAATKRGGIPALPDLKDITQFQEANHKI
ncbi:MULTISPECIES: carbohydrate kinase family protein [unclassified Psychrobacillus]|uniref:carbohydrate kinase family protein n=1 Tax=unclassified Psychrobacillus TaxID=2636677 RepID=UPI0012B0C413|nr:carbohydrate kinase [Bacillus sp. N3536]